jgi:hypothetical protein
MENLKMNAYKVIIVCCYSVFFTTCSGGSRTTQKDDSPPVAEVDGKYFSLNEYKNSYIKGGTVKDSLFLKKRAIDDRARTELFYNEAMAKLNAEEMSIEQEVQAYRKSLVNYIYQTKIIEANLDTNVSKREIEDYFNNHRDNFILKDNIVKVNYYKIPNKAAGLEKIKKILYFNLPKDKDQLNKLALQNAENFFTNDSTWLYLEDIKKEIPSLREQPDFNLKPLQIVQFTDDDYYYYLKIKDMKVKNGLSPITFERGNIKLFIISNRKTKLIQQYKQQLLDKARADKSLKVY